MTVLEVELSALGVLVTVTLTPDVGVYVWNEMGAEVLALVLVFETVFVLVLETVLVLLMVLVLVIVLVMEELLGGTAKVLAGPDL